MKLRPYSSSVLALGGIILMGLGVYFIFIRPSLLPEDARYMGTTLEQIQLTMPALLIWLRLVFWVMGGFMFATGVLTLYIALTSFQRREPGVAGIVALSGGASFGWMAVVNFILNSDFKWLILAFALLWVIALTF